MLVALASLAPIAFSVAEILGWYTENIFSKYDADYRTLWQRGDVYFISALVVPLTGAVLWGLAYWIVQGFDRDR